jgi:glucose/arabinose dehydrogenase
VLLQVDQPYANHNGGHLAFGPDGFLYVGLGDGGSGGDPEDRARNAATVLGKMLRVDRLGRGAPGNPVAPPHGDPRIWASGLRNPWRYSFDRATGDLFVADVGQRSFEEVNRQPAASRGGENYGWSCREGAHDFRPERCAPGEPLVDPILEYSHDTGGCSVTGGYRYRGTAIPALAGEYLFGDYCSGRIWRASPDPGGRWTARLLFDTELLVSSFGEDRAGEILVVDHRGVVYRLLP